MRRALAAFIVSAVLLVGATPPPRVEPLECNLGGIVQLSVHSGDASWSGTGFAVAQGILTNAHVVGDSDAVILVFPTWPVARAFLSRPLAIDAAADLALLELPIDLPITALAPTAYVPLGTNVRIVGFPMDVKDSPSMTRGIVSKTWDNDTGVTRVLTDAAVNPGNSGSPILANDCTALGIVNARVLGSYGMGLGIGADTLHAFLER